MKNIKYGLLVVFLFSVIGARELNLVMLLEEGREESFYKKSGGAFIIDFAEVVRQKSSPILVSGVILHNFLLSKKSFTQGLSRPGSVEKKMQELFNKLEENNREKDRLFKVFDKDAFEVRRNQLEQEIMSGSAYKERLEKMEQQLASETFWSASMREEIRATRLSTLRLENQVQVESMLTQEIESTSAQLKKLNEEFFHLRGEVDRLYQENPVAGVRFFCYLTPFNIDEWDVYKHGADELYLLVPKLYQERIMREWEQEKRGFKGDLPEIIKAFGITERELALGLTIDHVNFKKFTSLADLESMLDATWSAPTMKLFGRSATLDYLFSRKKINPVAVQSFFVQGREEIFGSWIIYWGGHGSYGTQAIGEVSEARPRALVQVEAYIAGLPINKFFDFLKFLQTKTKVDLLYYETCFGGGYHAQEIARFLEALKDKEQVASSEKTILKELQPNSVIVSGATTDASSFGANPTPDNILLYREKGFIKNYSKFFDEATQLFKQVRMKQRARLVADDFASALGHLVYIQRHSEDPHGISGLPLVWIPGAKKPEAIEATKEIYVIREDRPDLSAVDKEAVLLYPPIITHPLRIQSTRLLVPFEYQLPGLVSMQVGDAKHTFSTIEVSVKDEVGNVNVPNLNDFLRGLIYQLWSLFKKTYRVAHLEVRNFQGSGILQEDPAQKLELKDVVITKWTRVGWVTGDPKELKGEVSFKVKDDQGQMVTYKGAWDDKMRAVKKWQVYNEQGRLLRTTSYRAAR